jgi:hypothetical protein
MKKISTLVSILFFTINVFAQNVGIGTTTPNTILEVKKPLKSTVKISSTDFYDTTQLIFSNRTPTDAGTDILVSSNQEEGLKFSSKSDIVSQNNDNIMLLTPQGNVGIGTPTPAHLLDINGDVNTTGLMRLAGNAGLAGQVLTSSGNSAPPTWGKTAFSNNTRFSFGYTSFGTNRNTDSVRFNATRYNTNSVDVFISATQSRITINKTGLYHFDLGFYMDFNVLGGVTFENMHLSWDFINNTTPYVMVSNYKLSFNGVSPTSQFYGGQRLSIDMYCLAGSNLKLVRTFNPAPISTTNVFGFGDLTGYLISE